MTDTLHAFAQKDTPAVVNVPRDMAGLIFWAVGRFGSGILLAVACGYALSRVYDDLSRQQMQLMTILESRAKLDTELTGALLQLRSAIDEVAKDARSAHRAGGRSVEP